MEEKKVNLNEQEQNSIAENEQKTELTAAERILQRLKEKQNNSSESKQVATLKQPEETAKPVVEAVRNDVREEIVEAEKIEVPEIAVTHQETPAAPIIAETPVAIVHDIPEELHEEIHDDHHNIPDFTEMSRQTLLEKMHEYAAGDNALKQSKTVQILKSAYYTKLNAEKAEHREAFIQEGGDLKDYKQLEADENETQFAETFKAFMAKKSEQQEKLDKEMQANLAAKYDIIKAIEHLVNKPEAFGETYKEFQELQNRWRSTGIVPKAEQKALWDEYNRVTEAFFAYVKINKELRDLDLKKNLEEKIKLCEQAEELLLEPKIVKAQRKLQALHELWRETGPVIHEKKEEIWERFSMATKQINSKFSEHMEVIHVQQEKNLEAKNFLCEQAEEISSTEYENRNDWKDASDKIVKMQSLWKGIGFVPQKHNNEVYDRFRAACDKFFQRIRAFYDVVDAERDKNLQMKTDLCVQAETMQDSMEWKKTSDFYIKLQEEWKKVGPVPVKHSDKLWKRFRKACNTFFDNKKNHFKSRETQELENLKAKQDLIEKIKAVDTSKGKQEAVTALKEYQKEWTEIGFVPFDQKDSVYKIYREALDEKFGEMKMDYARAAEAEFDERVAHIRHSGNSEDMAGTEMGKLRNKIERLEADIQLWENNIGFFANTKNAEAMLKDFNKKIELSKQQVVEYKKQIKKLSEIS